MSIQHANICKYLHINLYEHAHTHTIYSYNLLIVNDRKPCFIIQQILIHTRRRFVLHVIILHFSLFLTYFQAGSTSSSISLEMFLKSNFSCLSWSLAQFGSQSPPAFTTATACYLHSYQSEFPYSIHSFIMPAVLPSPKQNWSQRVPHVSPYKLVDKIQAIHLANMFLTIWSCFSPTVFCNMTSLSHSTHTHTRTKTLNE